MLIGFNGVIGFSRYPLQLISLVGIVLSCVAFVLAVVYLGLKLGGQNFPVGNPTVVIVVAFFSGIQLLSLGVIGEYVGRIYDESQAATEVHRRVPLRVGRTLAEEERGRHQRRSRSGGSPVRVSRRSASSPAGWARAWASACATRRSR